MTTNDISPILILIAGGHASGKKTGALMLKEQLESKFKDEGLRIQTIDMDDFRTEIEGKQGSRLPSQYDFVQVKDHVENTMASLEYDVVIMFGLYALYDGDLVNMATVRVFIDCDSDVRLGRWIKRDVSTESHCDSAGATEKEKLEKLLNVYLNYSRNEMKLYIQDTKDRADVILPRGADVVGFTLIVDGLQGLLLKKIQLNHTMLESVGSLSTLQDPERSLSGTSLNRETAMHSIKLLSQEPSVMSLTNDNFSNKNKIFYDVN